MRRFEVPEGFTSWHFRQGMLMLSGELFHQWLAIWLLSAGVDIEAVRFAKSALHQVRCVEKSSGSDSEINQAASSLSGCLYRDSEEIKAKAPEAYLMTLTRRFMMRITDRIPGGAGCSSYYQRRKVLVRWLKSNH